MQKDPRHSRILDHFIALLCELAMDRNLSGPIIEALTPALKEKFFLWMREASLNVNTFNLLGTQPLQGKVFIPFDKWLKGQKTLNEFYRVFTRDGFLRHCKEDRLKPDFVSMDFQTVKLIWIGTIPELIYTSHRLIHTYNAIPGSSNYALILWENYLFTDSSGNIIEPTPNSLKSIRTKYSQIVKEITDKKRTDHNIDRSLSGIFDLKS